MIRLKEINKTFTNPQGKHSALAKLSLDIEEGSQMAILGQSGSGKSTLMNIIGLLDSPSQGTYLLNGKNTFDFSEKEWAQWRNQSFGFIFQQFHLLPQLNALENVLLPLQYRSLSSTQARSKAELALDRVGMSEYTFYQINQLSGGQQQRIAIARALVGDPPVILADEPTGALDQKTGQDIMKLFFSFCAQGSTLIMVTHDLNIAQSFKQRICMHQGYLTEEYP